MTALPRIPFADATEVEFALIAGRVEDAARREDIVQTLISTADLDRMARNLGPQHAAAARHAQDVVARAIAALEQAIARGEAGIRRDDHLRAAYAVTGDRSR
ncbi:hypothetical protein C0V75_14455 [Tabrizicola sp. TH137]|uniref:hypothetical protein n=1 Tax=Tabrizicola sp. TH137 TaxID=2067452 RepID=UPI000C7C4215|nr:hypothetical protein [Tabrizicola sp. TH137]PLL12081.1 hypothetical protein C0V75_14455 [Tabrizicola sp. TH137]